MRAWARSNSTPMVPIGEHVQTRLENDPSSFQQRLSFSFIVDLLVLRSFDTFDLGPAFVPCLADALDRFGFGDDVRQYPPPEATDRARTPMLRCAVPAIRT